jgi:hypothetical protein
MQEKHYGGRKKREQREPKDEDNQAFVILSKNTLEKAKREIN